MLKSHLSLSLASIFGAAALGALLFTVSGCGSARRGIPLVEKTPDSQPFLKGEKIFMMHCNHCHPSGTAGLGPALNNKPLPRWLIGFQVRNGLGVMPAFPKEKISEEDLDNLTLYLSKLRNLSAQGDAGAHAFDMAATLEMKACIAYRPTTPDARVRLDPAHSTPIE